MLFCQETLDSHTFVMYLWSALCCYVLISSTIMDDLLTCCIQFITVDFELKWTKFTNKWFLRVIFRYDGKSYICDTICYRIVFVALLLEAGQSCLKDIQFYSFICWNLMFSLVCFALRSFSVAIYCFSRYLSDNFIQRHTATHCVCVCAMCTLYIYFLKRTKEKIKTSQ